MELVAERKDWRWKDNKNGYHTKSLSIDIKCSSTKRSLIISQTIIYIPIGIEFVSLKVSYLHSVGRSRISNAPEK